MLTMRTGRYNYGIMKPKLTLKELREYLKHNPNYYALSTDYKLLPEKIGYGFCLESDQHPFDIERLNNSYRVERVGRYINCHFQLQPFVHMPLMKHSHWHEKEKTFDGFSPNLNKKLHMGHLRNMVLANAYMRLFCLSPVAMLGCDNQTQEARDTYLKWCKFLSYEPEIYNDVDLAQEALNDDDIMNSLEEGNGQYLGAKMIPGTDLVAIRSDNTPTYNFHDYVFAKKVSPDYYLTGMEQIDHFKELGLGDKHLPIGLVLNNSGKKTSSRTGDALTIDDMFEQIIQQIKTINPNLSPQTYNALAWNVCAIAMMTSKRTSNVAFDPNQILTVKNTPGLYMSYTLVRLTKLYEKYEHLFDQVSSYRSKIDIQNAEMPVLANIAYMQYYEAKSIENKDVVYYVQGLMQLCKSLNALYDRERIEGASQSYLWAMMRGLMCLECAMHMIGLHYVEEI